MPRSVYFFRFNGYGAASQRPEVKFSHQLTYLLLRYMALLLRHANQRQRIRYASRLGALTYQHLPLRRNQARGNIQRAFPEKRPAWCEQVLQNCYQFFCHSMVQFLSLPDSYRAITLQAPGRPLLEEALTKGKGVILVSGHFGMWEFMAAYLGFSGYSECGVAQRQKNRGADRVFNEIRSVSGLRQIYSRDSTHTMLAALKGGQILLIASDQDAKGRGVFVNFCGHPASTPRGAAVFHLKTKAPILFGTVYRDHNNTYTFECQPVRVSGKPTVAKITQAVTNHLEAYIRRYPEQYFWFHRRWRTKMVPQG